MSKNKLFKGINSLIGNTPLIDLAEFAAICCPDTGIKILGKAEFFNPTGSAKDRAALYMINCAEEDEVLSPGGTIIEPTSGNTGLGLAAIGRARGYRVIIVMPDNMSEERQALMKAYGAELVLTPGRDGMSGAIAKAEELQKSIAGSFIPNQFDNPANAKAHYETTGPELWQDSDGKIDILVAGIGTGGTITGSGRYLKEQNPDIKIVGVEPASSPLLTEGRAGSHGLQGIGANFIPSVLDRDVLDEVLTVTEDDAYKYGRLLGQTEGILSGISSGAALAAAVKLGCRPENKGNTIAVILVDGCEKYLSTPMYRN